MLPEGVLEKIKEIIPKTEKGNYKYKFHQSLSPEIGREHLKKQIIETTMIMRMSRTKKEFIKRFNEMYNKNIQLEMEFEEEVFLKDQLFNDNKNSKKALLFHPNKKEYQQYNLFQY